MHTICYLWRLFIRTRQVEIWCSSSFHNRIITKIAIIWAVWLKKELYSIARYIESFGGLCTATKFSRNRTCIIWCGRCYGFVVYTYPVIRGAFCGICNSYRKLFCAWNCNSICNSPIVTVSTWVCRAIIAHIFCFWCFGYFPVCKAINDSVLFWTVCKCTAVCIVYNCQFPRHTNSIGCCI